MLQEAYAHLSSVAANYIDPIVATAFENWPQLYQDHALARPVASLPLSVDQVEAVLRGVSDRARWKQQPIVMAKMADYRLDLGNDRLFPKIGPVSWKEVPAFHTIIASEVAPLLPGLLASVTSRMAIILEAFVIKNVPTFLHLLPAIDLSFHAEVRVKVRHGQMVEARWQSIPEGTRPDAAMKESIMECASMLCKESPLPQFAMDLCVDCSARGAPAKLIEINPDIPPIAGAKGRIARS